MLIKVCGIRENEDLVSVSKLGVDYAGFHFFPLSPRYAPGSLDPMLAELLSRSVATLKKTGVFFNAEPEEITDAISNFHLDAVQLNGSESPELCAQLSERTEVIKSFALGEEFDFSVTADYEGTCSLFLFDTENAIPADDAYSFHWSQLSAYDGSTPFLVSGGIGSADTVKVLEFTHPQFAGIDINTRFELYPGKKDIPRLTSFIRTFKPAINKL